MNLKRAWSAYAVANKKLYVIGGGSLGKLYEAVECFDPRSETWMSVAPLKERRFVLMHWKIITDLKFLGEILISLSQF